MNDKRTAQKPEKTLEAMKFDTKYLFNLYLDPSIHNRKIFIKL